MANTSPITDFLGYKVKCVFRQGTNPDVELTTSPPVCKNIKDEIHIDFTGANPVEQITPTERIITINAKYTDKYTTNNNNDYKTKIHQKYKDMLNLPTEIDFTDKNFTLSRTDTGNILQIKITLPLSCSNSTNPPVTSACTYDETKKKWVATKKYNYLRNGGFPSEAKFNELCKSETVDCAEDKSCVLDTRRTISTCQTASSEVYEFPILKKSSGNGVTCKNVANMSDVNNSEQFEPVETDSKITFTRKNCNIINSFSPTCVADSANVNRLVRTIVSCTPPGNDMCKVNTCIELFPDMTAHVITSYDELNKKKKIIISLKEGYNNNSTSTSGDDPKGLNNTEFITSEEVQNFLKQKLHLEYDITDFKYEPSSKTITITISYSCGDIEKTYENNGNCIYDTTNNNWIKRYTKSYKNSVNVDDAKKKDLCSFKNNTDKETEDCTTKIDCELSPDDTISTACVGSVEKISFNIVKRNTRTGDTCKDVAAFNNPSYNFREIDNKIVGQRECRISCPSGKKLQGNICVDDIPNVDCQYTYSACDKACGGGKEQLQITKQSSGTGQACPTQTQRDCNMNSCPPEQVSANCKVSDWSSWTDCDKPCGGGTQSRTRTIVTPASGTGTCAESTSLRESRACNQNECTVDCQVSDWGACSASCGGGTKTRTVITQPKGNGAICPVLTTPCNTQQCSTTPVTAVDCKVGEFGACSKTCGGGTKTRPILVSKQGNGAACPALSESCNTQTCPVPVAESSNKMMIIMIAIMFFLLVGGGIFLAMRKK